MFAKDQTCNKVDKHKNISGYWYDSLNLPEAFERSDTYLVETINLLVFVYPALQRMVWNEYNR